MAATDRQRLVNFFANSDRFKTDMCSTMELGIYTLETINDILAPLTPFFDRAEKGIYPLASMKDADLRAMSGTILPLRFEAPAYRLVSLSEAIPRPDWMSAENHATSFDQASVLQLLQKDVWRTFAEELTEGWDAVVASRLPREVTLEKIRIEVWYALGMAMHTHVTALGRNVWQFIEAPIVLYIGSALAREDRVTRYFAALLPHLLKILPIGAMPGPAPYGGPLLCITA